MKDWKRFGKDFLFHFPEASISFQQSISFDPQPTLDSKDKRTKERLGIWIGSPFLGAFSSLNSSFCIKPQGRTLWDNIWNPCQRSRKQKKNEEKKEKIKKRQGFLLLFPFYSFTFRSLRALQSLTNDYPPCFYESKIGKSDRKEK